MALEAVETEPKRDDILGFISFAPSAMRASNNDRTWWGYGRQVERAMQEAEKDGYFVAGVIGVDQGSFKALWKSTRKELLRFHALQRIIQVGQGTPPTDWSYRTGLTSENLIDIAPNGNDYYYSATELKGMRSALVAKQKGHMNHLFAKHRKDIRDLEANMTIECKRVLETKGVSRYGRTATTYEWYLVLMKRK